jgi:hypothetical protein
MKVKSLLCLFIIFITILSTIVPTFAHSGRTDSNGGHYNHSTGEYHYHHGYSAHQHTNGKCPYSSNNSAGDDSFGFGDFIVILLWVAVGIGVVVIIKKIFES